MVNLFRRRAIPDFNATTFSVNVNKLKTSKNFCKYATVSAFYSFDQQLRDE